MMWGCGTNYPFGFGQWFLAGRIIGFTLKMFIFVVILVLLYRLIKSLTLNTSENLDKKDSLEIIKVKLAQGEINEEEYQRLKKVLSM